ncbi:MAG: glycosyltransferase family 2 protein [Desulfobacterales bacterium]|jgi:glycosyltransferase involved in cell wall biosynthesis|nr:glycosyltransferase family 2 protein [Desulfobacterales bacterium]|tara:strand:+ start:544 stop:1512 length:969 start_codon:yes stop_codon:yes gene_type:complete
MMQVEISVIVPLHNEESNLVPLFDRLNQTLLGTGSSFEIIFINDSSSDNSEFILKKIYEENADNVIIINLFMRVGKTGAQERGFEIARGEYIVTIDSDLENSPEDIPKLLTKMDEGFDVVSGLRISRVDSKGKLITSRMFNLIMRWITGLAFNDYFSGLKCFRADVIHFLAIYGDLYRFTASLAYRAGFKVVEIPVEHHHREGGESKYSFLSRVRRAIDDLLVVFFAITFNRKRIYRLGITSILLSGIGVVLLFASIVPSVFGDGELNYGLIRISSIIIFISIQIYLLKNLSDNFLRWHKEEYLHRKQNIKKILGLDCASPD